MTPAFRVAASLAVIVACWWLDSLLGLFGPVVSADLATSQLANSDVGYATAQLGMHLSGGAGLSVLVMLLALLVIWWRPLRARLRGMLAAAALLGALAAPAQAYYSKTDYAETFEIAPNQSAFLIPLQGANKDSQAQFMSQEYLAANKVAAKRVQVPHVKLSGSGSFSDYYIPAAKLILVDRAPYNREWTNNPTTGTSNRHEGFNLESRESINIEVDITIAASVSEEQAAAFLYRFGTVSAVNTATYDPSAQYQSDAYYAQSYASVAYGRSLASVMDTVGRGRVQAALAREFGSRALQDAIEHKAEIMKAVSDDVTGYFATRGVTIEYIGYASSLNFDAPVQTAINNVYIATRRAEEISAQERVLPVKRALAEIGLMESASQAAVRWNGALPQLPSFVVLPADVASLLQSWLPPRPPAAKP